jgi:hypothetical protein
LDKKTVRWTEGAGGMAEPNASVMFVPLTKQREMASDSLLKKQMILLAESGQW